MKLFKNPEFLIKTAFFLFVLAVCFVAVYFSLDRYHNFVYGKFDLGNMNQMLYNSARGDFMILTDYFGQNLPRWSMSHVDPSLLIFIPVSWFFTDASFLLIAQTISFGISSLLIYLIAKKEGLTTLQSSLIGSVMLLFPISGYILVWTTFHPLILAMPFLLFAYYLLQKENNKSQAPNDKQKPNNKRFKFEKLNIKYCLNFVICNLRFIKNNLNIILVYIFFLLVILSKEELGIVVASFIPFLFFKFKNLRKHLLVIGIFSFLWSVFSLFVLIPAYSQTRAEGLNEFVTYIGGVEDSNFEQFTNENYFLYRYEQFGSSYTEILKNVLLNPGEFLSVLFTESNIVTLKNLLIPAGLSIIFTPLLLISALPEVMIQMLTGDPEVFSVQNHRLLIVIPILSLSIIEVVRRLKNKSIYFSYFYLLLIIFFSIFYSFKLKNPLVYPVYDRVAKALAMSGFPVSASNENNNVEFYNDIRKICAQSVVDELEKYQKVSVPQPLGAKTSNKKFNALFPAGLEDSEAFVTDIYARKLVDFLDLDVKYNSTAVKKTLTDYDFNLIYACDRFFVFEKTTGETSNGFINIIEPIEEGVDLLEKSSFHEFTYIQEDNLITFNYKYTIGDEKERSSLFSYTVLTSGDRDWVFIHYPSTYQTTLNDVPSGSALEEEFTLPIPSFIDPGEYEVYFGIGNRENNEENIKAGKLKIKN